jgi:hypothetical protein
MRQYKQVISENTFWEVKVDIQSSAVTFRGPVKGAMNKECRKESSEEECKGISKL